MIPVVGLLAASGILKGILALLTQVDVVEAGTNTYTIIDTMLLGRCLLLVRRTRRSRKSPVPELAIWFFRSNNILASFRPGVGSLTPSQ